MEEKEPKPLTTERVKKLADEIVANEYIGAFLSVHVLNIALIIEMTPPEFINDRVNQYILESLHKPR